MSKRFEEQTIYGASKWEETSREKMLDADDLKIVEKVEIKELEKDGDSWLSMCFFIKGSRGYKPFYLDRDSSLEEGDLVDPKSVVEIEYTDENGEIHYRVDGKRAK